MKIKKFEEGYKSGDYDYEYGGHTFVLARYKGGWDNIRGSFGLSFYNDEFVPCMIKGHIIEEWQKQEVYIIGSNNSYNIDMFEILKGSDKGFKEMIEMYAASNKYNL